MPSHEIKGNPKSKESSRGCDAGAGAMLQHTHLEVSKWVHPDHELYNMVVTAYRTAVKEPDASNALRIGWPPPRRAPQSRRDAARTFCMTLSGLIVPAGCAHGVMQLKNAVR